MSHADGGMEEIEADILRNMLQVLFGESAAYIGDAVETMPERRRANVVRLCKIALKRLGAAVSTPAEIPPRVVGLLLNEGSFIRGTVSSEYWGGALSCARGPNPRDDRAARWLHLLSRLGEYELRSHYLLYSSMRVNVMLYRDPGNIDFNGDTMGIATFIPLQHYIAAMDYNQDETERVHYLNSAMLYSLGQEHLVGGSNRGPEEYLREQFRTNATDIIKGDGIVFAPSLLGTRLFLTAFGRADVDERFILDPGLDCAVDGVPVVVNDSGLVYAG